MASRRLLAAVSALVAALSLTIGPAAMAAWEVNLPFGVTPLSQEIYDLHMLIFWICVVIGVIVFGAMIVSMFLHRKSKGRTAAHFHHSTLAEILWTVVPIVILVSMAIPATFTLIDIEDTSEADMTLKVTGYQWKWRYDYIEDGVSFYSNLAPSSRAAIYGDPHSVENYLLEVDKRVVLPVGKKVRVLITADDVIHAWWVPAFGMKKDAIPGYINEIWVQIEEPGIYRGQCAELCGKDHGFMPIVVEGKPQAEYDKWLAAVKGESPTRLAAQKASAQPDDIQRAEPEQGDTMTSGAAEMARPAASAL